MTINDEPSLTKRLSMEALKKMLLASPCKLCSCIKKNVFRIFVSIGVLVSGVFFLTMPVSSHQKKEVANESLQRYNACVLRKDVFDEEKKDASLALVDDECVQLSRDGKIKEDENYMRTQEIATMLEGSPMEDMAEYIAQQDQKVAGLIVGIAMIESQWGRHAPSKNGIDCYNYWGYKTIGSRGQSMGYACFGSREEAVNAVGERLTHFVYDTHRDTPAKMVYPWKCGGSCASHSPESVARWVGTVNTYYSQIIALEDNESNVSHTKFLSRK